MATVKLKGDAIHTSGELPTVGEVAPPFLLTGPDLQDVTLDSLGKKWKLLNIFPSIDTSVCAASVRQFHTALSKKEGVVIVNISADLPFAQGRFCASEGIENALSLSAFRSSFGLDYGVEIVDGPLRELLARATIVLDPENRVVYTDLVPEITEEPNYTAALEKCP